jgi:hypothetical protein
MQKFSLVCDHGSEFKTLSARLQDLFSLLYILSPRLSRA